MKKQFSLIITSLLVSGLLLLSGCKGGSTEQEQTQETNTRTTSVGIQANVGSFNNNGQFQSVTGSMNNIDKMEITVKDASTDAVYKEKILMTFTDGKWSTLIENIPVDKNLAFSVDAYEQDSESTTNMVKTYSGVTYKLLQGGDSITVNLFATNAINVVTMPQLYAVESMENVAVDVTTDINLIIRGRANATVNYSITSPTVGGTFIPKSGTIQLNGNTATLVVGYIASVSSIGTHTHIIRLTDELGNRIDTSFKTTVVLGEQNSSAVFSQFAPRFKYTTMSPKWFSSANTDYVRMYFYFEDDKSLDYAKYTLVLTKDSTDDSTYIYKSSTCSTSYCYGELENYDPRTKGWLKLTVTDIDGLSTSVSTYISENLFPSPNQ